MVGWAVALAACSLPSVDLWSGSGRANTGLFQLYGDRIAHGAVPYRPGFSFEYPPAAIPPLAVPALPHAHYVVWFHVFELACELAAVAAVALLLRPAGPVRRLAGVSAAGVAPALLGQITLNAFDLWPAALAALAVTVLLQGRPRLGFLLLGIATAAKLYPALLAPVLLTWVARRRGRAEAVRALASGAATVAAISLPFAVLGPGGLGYSLREQLTRGLQVESLGGSILGAAHRLGAGFHVVVSTSPFSYDFPGTVAGIVATVSTLLLLLAVLVVWHLFRSGAPDRERLLLAVAASAVAFVAFAKVLSPQYLLFLVPFIPLVRSATAMLLFFASLALTQVWARFPEPFAHVTELRAIIWVTLVRNLVLVALFGALALRLRPEPG